MDATIANQVMETTTNQLVFELSSLIITGIFGIIGYYAKRFLTTNEFIKKYNLDNEMTERILANALAHAEVKAKAATESEINKLHLAVSYIEKVAPEVISKQGDKLELMLERKLYQINQQYQPVTNTPVTPSV